MTQYPNQPYGGAPAGAPLGTHGPAQIEALKKKALIWTIAGFLCGGVISGVLGLLGYVKADTEPETAEKFTKWAMILTIIVPVLSVLMVIGCIILTVVLGDGTAATAGH